MLIEHPRIYTRAETGALTDALLVRDGVVVAHGAKARAERAPDERVVRPEAACLFPALADAHIHLWGIGMRPDLLDLTGARSTDEVYARVERAARDARGAWIIGGGWDQNLWAPGARLERARLDAAAGGRRVWLKRVDHHAAFVSTSALEAAGMTSPRDFGQAGHVELAADGSPTGLLVDAAMEPVEAILPEVTEEEDERLLVENAARLRRVGIASGHMAYVSVERLAMLERLVGEGRLPIRTYCMVDALDERAPELAARGPLHDPSAVCSVGAFKLFADGAMGSRGALMLEPYVDGGCGLAVVDAPELLERIPALLAGGWQVAVHAIGDLGARHVLDAFAKATGDERARARPRLEHAQIMEAGDVARMGELGVIASVQPIHMFSDAPWAHRALSEAQLARLFSYADLADVAPVCAGSDYPIDDQNPWRGMRAAITREGADGRVFRADQALGRQAILDAYTRGAAWAAHWERALGALDPGFCADVIGLSDDPFACSDDALGEMEVPFTHFALTDE